MNNIKSIIAQNITDLRRAKGMTQLELAEQLNYSDKAVSKWERAESMPDVSVLVEIADLFEVPLDYLVRAEHPQKEIQPSEEALSATYRKGYISGISILLVWLIVVLVYILISFFAKDAHSQWLSFVYAIPVSAIVWLVFNSIWFNPRLNYFLTFNVVRFFEYTINTALPKYQSRADLSARDSGTDYHYPVGADKKAPETGRTCLIHFLRPANLENAGFFHGLSCW